METENQSKIDEINMKRLNDANRLYRKCISEKCPSLMKRTSRHRKKFQKFTSKKHQNRVLVKIWKEKGIERKIRFYNDTLNKLEKGIKVASAKPYIVDNENHFKAIESYCNKMQDMEKEIEKTKDEINHLKSQLVRVSRKMDELNQETESEDKFQIHLHKAKHLLEVYEDRVERSRQSECLLTVENEKLREIIVNMLFDRAVFNSQWSKIVKNLKNRRKFLLDMIERSNQAFNHGAEQLEGLEKLQMSSKNDREMHIAEMVTVEREIRANEIMKMFLGGKGKRRIMEPLESREVRRRDQFKLDHANRLNIYYEIINNIMKFTKTSNIVNSKNLFVRDENEGFQYYILFNFINNQLESFSNSLAKESTEIQASQDYFNNLMKFYDQKIEELRREFGEKVAQLLPLKNYREKLVSQLMQHLKTIEDVMKTLECDFSSVQKLLGDHKKITLLNIPEFFSLLEQRINEVLAFVYCDQRKNVDLFNDDKNLCVRSLKRSAEDFVKIEDVITTQQCAECAEREDINRYDETIVYPLDIETIKEKMREKIYSPDMLRRLHNLSKCNLPRSGIIASRRYVE